MPMLLTWLINALALLIITWLVPSIHIRSFGTALIVAVVLGLINAVLRPLLILLTLPVTIITLGLFILVVNALCFWLAASLLKGFEVSGFWSAFFGWLAATGTAVILTALVAAAGAAVGVAANGSPSKAADAAGADANTVGVVGIIALVVVLFVSYFCGGYVAGRMARFDGLKQGFAVWLWAVIVAVIVAIVTAIAGAQYNILGNLNSFPRIPLDEGNLTVAGIVTVIAVAIVSLIGALLGGLAGMRYHRKVDRVGLGR